jgi:hypothetical protein
MTAAKRTIEIDGATAAALEDRAAEAGLSVSELLAAMVAQQGEPSRASPADMAELDRSRNRTSTGPTRLLKRPDVDLGFQGPMHRTFVSNCHQL